MLLFCSHFVIILQQLTYKNCFLCVLVLIIRGESYLVCGEERVGAGVALEFDFPLGRGVEGGGGLYKLYIFTIFFFSGHHPDSVTLACIDS
jgi:hypothetical protein